MITISWVFVDGYWTAEVDLDDEQVVEDYKPLPNVKAKATSRNRNQAVAYALEDLAKMIREAS